MNDSPVDCQNTSVPEPQRDSCHLTLAAVTDEVTDAKHPQNLSVSQKKGIYKNEHQTVKAFE